LTRFRVAHENLTRSLFKIATSLGQTNGSFQLWVKLTPSFAMRSGIPTTTTTFSKPSPPPSLTTALYFLRVVAVQGSLDPSVRGVLDFYARIHGCGKDRLGRAFCALRSLPHPSPQAHNH
jgi:hypothetical protein